MQNTKFYQIITENNLNINNINYPIGILMLDIISNKDAIRNLIQNNPKTEFWLAIDKMKKETILLANELGVKNIITPPINETTIKNYFEKNLCMTKYLYLVKYTIQL